MKKLQELFDHMCNQHGLILLQSEMFDIIDIVNKIQEKESEEEYEPYFGWCDVDGCEKEAANGGGCWRETGHWTVCSNHSSKYRAGEPQPPMKQTAIDREERRGADGVLVNEY